MTPIDKAIVALEGAITGFMLLDHLKGTNNQETEIYKDCEEALTSLKALKESVGDVESLKALQTEIMKAWSYTPFVGGHEIRSSSKTAAKIGAVLLYLSERGLLQKPTQEVDVDALKQLARDWTFNERKLDMAEYIDRSDLLESFIDELSRRYWLIRRAE